MGAIRKKSPTKQIQDHENLRVPSPMRIPSPEEISGHIFRDSENYHGG